MKPKRVPHPITVENLARSLKIGVRRVQQLSKEGMPHLSHGLYNERECLDWYLDFLHAALEKKSVVTDEGEYSNEKNQRIRKLTAEADLREIQLAVTRGKLITIEESEKILSDLVLTTKARIMAIPARLAPELVGETSRVMIQAKIEKANREALAYLAKAGDDVTGNQPG